MVNQWCHVRIQRHRLERLPVQHLGMPKKFQHLGWRVFVDVMRVVGLVSAVRRGKPEFFLCGCFQVLDCGLDVADMGRDSNALCLRYGGYVPRLKTWNGVDPDATAIKAAEMCKSVKSRCVNVDATGVGAGVAPRMTRLGVTADSIKVAESPTRTVEQGEFAMLRDQLWWEAREWLRTDPGAMLPPDERLVEGLTKPQYGKNSKGKIKVTAKETLVEQLGYSPDEADALCLTFAPSKSVRVAFV